MSVRRARGARSTPTSVRRLLRRRHTVGDTDVRDKTVPELVIVDSHDCDVDHAGLRQKHFLYRPWEHVLAAPDDHVLDATRNEEATFGIGMADVTRGHRPGGSRRSAPGVAIVADPTSVEPHRL